MQTGFKSYSHYPGPTQLLKKIHEMSLGPVESFME